MTAPPLVPLLNLAWFLPGVPGLLLTLTIISRQGVRKNVSRTIHQKEKVIQIIDILIAVELSCNLVFYTGLTWSTCALLLSAIILANNIR